MVTPAARESSRKNIFTRAALSKSENSFTCWRRRRETAACDFTLRITAPSASVDATHAATIVSDVGTDPTPHAIPRWTRKIRRARVIVGRSPPASPDEDLRGRHIRMRVRVSELKEHGRERTGEHRQNRGWVPGDDAAQSAHHGFSNSSVLVGESLREEPHGFGRCK